MKLQKRYPFALVCTMALAMLGAAMTEASSAVAAVSLDAVQLGDAPRLDVPQDTAGWQESVRRKSAQALTRAQARDTIAQFYRNVYVPGMAVTLLWTGSVAGCNAGTTNVQHRQAVIDRVNYFRTLVDQPPVTLLDGLPTTQVQAAALMMSANNALSHTPPASWLCYSTNGANGAGSANIALGAYGVGAIDLYVDDPGSNNTVAGHRRWILYPPQLTMATGDVSRTSVANLEANALNVIGIFGTRPATPNGIAWPPAGFVPYQNLPAGSNRWSFSYPSAGLTGASVTMTGPAGPIPVTLEAVANGFGDNTVVFRPTGVPYGNPGIDTTYTINVSGMTGTNVPPSIQYTVTVIDPYAAPVLGLSLAVSSNANPSLYGQSVTFTAAVTGNAATPTGTVTFKDGAGAIAGCSGKTLDGTGHATCLSSGLAGGTHSISIDYSGDGTYPAGTSSAVAQVVSPTSQTIGPITSSPLALSYSPGGTFIVSATATSALTVTFGSQTPGVCSVNGSTATMLAAGTCTIAANQAGNANYLAAAQRTQNFTIIGVSSNVALASAGAVATASSTYGAAFPASAVNDNNRAVGYWIDGTYGAFPDWVQINFNGTKTIDHVVVYSLQDNLTSPVEPTDTQTFSLYGITDFTVQGWDGLAWVTLGSVTGNNLVKRTVNFAAVSTDRIRVNVTNARDHAYSYVAEIEAWGTNSTPPPLSINVALASLGAAATASSAYGAAFPASAVNDNNRAVGYWIDGTYGAFPDWVQITFTGTKTIDRVVVYSLQDNLTSPVEPTDTQTFSLYGITDFTVEGWNGSAWVTLGSAAGNNLVKRTVNFTAFAADRIRVNVTNARDHAYSYIAEIEAWTTTAPPPPSSNVALASAGAVATASSTYGAAFPASAVNDNNRAVGYWIDGTYGAFPDWVQIIFNGTKTIDHVVVYSLQDNLTSPVEPTDTQTFSLYGITDLTVEGWNGSAWVTLGSAAGNNLVKRTVNFTAFGTDRIRVNITNARDHAYSYVAEIEAWGY